MKKVPTEEQVPFHLIHHFIRGYYDGDGVCRYGGINKGFLGTYDLLNSIKKHIEIKH